MYSSQKSIIKNLALNLEIDATTDNIICPFCNGGDHKDKSFSITRLSTGLLYNCFRGKCGQKGFIPSVSFSLLGGIRSKKIFKPRHFPYDLSTLTPTQYAWFYTTFGITRQEVKSNGFRWSTQARRYYLPLLDIRGYSFGGIARTWEKGRATKSLTYRVNDVPMLHFPIRENLTRTLVIVEDTISAVKVARQCSSVALLSCNLNNQQVGILAKMFRNVIIALDPDASKVAISLRKKYKLAFRGNLSVALLSKDPKDLTDDEIREEIFNGETPS